MVGKPIKGNLGRCMAKPVWEASAYSRGPDAGERGHARCFAHSMPMQDVMLLSFNRVMGCSRLHAMQELADTNVTDHNTKVYSEDELRFEVLEA